MSEFIWKKISYLISLVSIGLVFGLAVFNANIEIKDLDLWLHIATGRFILQHGFVPGYDILSNSIAGKAWVNHEWLFQILVAKIYAFAGGEGLLTMQAILVALTLGLLFLLSYNREKPMLSSFLLLCVLMVYSSRFTIRPDLFSLLFFVVYVLVLSLFIQSRISIYLLFVTQVLWTNMHGFFFFGPFIVLLAIGNEWIKRHVKLPWEWNNIGRLSDDEFSRLITILFFVLGACLINPLTFEGAVYPLKVLTQLKGESKIFFDHIQELQRPIQWGTMFSFNDAAMYKFLIYLSFLSFVLNHRRIDVGSLIFWLVFLIFSLSAKRNMSYFGFAAFMVCSANFMQLRLYDVLPIRFINEKFREITAILLKIFFCAWIISFASDLTTQGYYDFDKYERKSEFGGIAQHNYPDKAADFLVENHVKGNFFNDFNSGAYLLGRCFPDIKVFIDGRTEVYGSEFFKMYQKMWKDGDEQLLNQAIEKFNLTGALLNSATGPIPSKTLNYFYKLGWPMVYFDYDAVIFLKDVPQNKKVIEKYRIDFKTWKPKSLDLFRLGAVRVTPSREVNRAYTLETLNLDDLALQEAEKAAEINPGFEEPYKIMGKIYGKRKDNKNAFKYFRMAGMLDPYNLEIRYNLALAYENLGDFKNAVIQYEKLLAQAPKEVKAHFRMALALIKEGEYDKGLRYLNQAAGMDPSAVADIFKVGDYLYEEKKYEMAVKSYEVGLTTNRNLAQIHYKIGLAYLGLHETEKAREHFKKGLEINPDHELIKEEMQKLSK